MLGVIMNRLLLSLEIKDDIGNMSGVILTKGELVMANSAFQVDYIWI